MVSSFADRLWWSRHRAGLGATRLARLVKCSQSLISGLERNNAEKSKLNNKFAHALGVHPTWLAFGNPELAPEGFDETTARRGRETMGDEPPKVVRLPAPPQPAPQAEPRWAADRAPVAEPLAALTGADAMMKSLVNQFMDFARLAGAECATKLLETLQHIVGLISFEEADGDQHVTSPNKRDNSTSK